MPSKISWTQETWNPVRGCEPVSPGCANCYAARQAARLMDRPGGPYEGLTRMTRRGAAWTGEVRLVPEMLGRPLRWQKPRMVFVNSMSDLFHDDVPDEFLDRVFAVMAISPRHTFQILTKRPERMLAYLESFNDDLIEKRLGPACEIANSPCASGLVEDADWPLPNVWIGVTAEDQMRANERVPLLLRCPAEIRFVSCEPLLGPVDLGSHLRGLNWVIAGGESGTSARPMHPVWARALRNQCMRAFLPFHFKQWGEWMPDPQFHDHLGFWSRAVREWEKTPNAPEFRCMDTTGRVLQYESDFVRAQHDTALPVVWCTRAACHPHSAQGILDGVEHREFPQTTSSPCVAR